MHFIRLWKLDIYLYIYIYIYIVEKYIQLYIVYDIQEPLGILLKWEHMFTSLPPRRLRWSAWAAGRSSPNCVPAPYSGNVTSRTRQNRSQSDAPGPKTDLRIVSLRPERPDANGPGPWGPAPLGKNRSKYTRGQSQETVLLGPACADSGSLVFLRDDAGLRTVVSNRRLLRQSWCQGPGLVRAGPSGEERCTPHYTVPVSPQCPQEISLLTLPVFQGAAVSSERFSQSLPPRNVAELGGSPPLRGSLEQLDRPSPAGPPFQGTELAALSTPEASLKWLVPLVSHLAVWEPLPSVSYWVLPEQTLVL